MTFDDDVMMVKREVAVLCAAFNGAKWISDQIESILQQDGVSVTLFISVDLSQDSTLAICKRFAAHYRNVRLLPFGGYLGSAAANFYRLIREVETSQYGFISLADQDDVWEPSHLSDGIDDLLRTGSDGYSCNVEAFWSDGRKKLIVKSAPQTQYDHYFEAPGPGCSFIMTSRSFSNLRVFLSEKVDDFNFRHHDWFIYAFYRSRGYNWIISEEARIRYRQHGSNAVGANVGTRAAATRLIKILNGEFFSDVHSLFQLLPPNPVVNFGFSFLVRNFLRTRRTFFDCIIILLLSPFGLRSLTKRLGAK